jgi:transposase-like protein
MERILEMARKKTVVKSKDTRRCYTDEFESEAVQMMLDGHSAQSVMKRRGLPNVNMLYRWKQERLTQRGPVASFRQMAHKRTNNRFEDLDGVYLVGGGTHPY